MPKRITSPRRKKKMASKARMPRGSKEAKAWNLKMQEAKRKKKTAKNNKGKKVTSPVKKSKKKVSSKTKKVRFSRKRLEVAGDFLYKSR